MMRHRYLEVTFRGGKPLAAYLYLPRRQGETSARTERRDGGLLLDFSADGRVIGIEITSPRTVTVTALNRLLLDLHEQPLEAQELAPLAA